MVKFDRVALERYLVELIDRPMTVPLEFNPEWNFASGQGLGFRRLVDHIMGEIEAGEEFANNRALMSELERSLMAYLLHCQPNTYSEVLRSTITAAAPRHIMKAIEYMRTYHAQSISIHDLADAAGVSARALHEGFKQFRSTTPMAMLKAIRLNHARQGLLAAGRDDRVMTIARRCGFTNLGRFSRLYVARYGELPSQTLRR
jgi:transcriptional regulator GlxA family with amidase domain